ncbi:DUF2842 domain-containing protein [Rubellimicrobium sp. CFH 75288]|uniref:DUF2842 domain-containing protein n=1 Tax=Rubellimicrobium sp. CFH 75288 TaxID=2697034 RepID=UPI0014130A57|nr:DUF2842 domain-containing protein [Rubellimicrobium sp. CFH 75288]NAZ36290.1 DUF2842 domain-containing protein [Rubellimicrobium sp. CFH 75288]
MSRRKGLSWRARRRWAIVVLVVGLPAYVVVAVSLVNWAEARLGRPVWWLELMIYVALGILWAVPFRRLFRGIGRPDPDEPSAPDR